MATARIRLHHLRENLHQLQQACPNSRILAMFKANAYGHGSRKLVEFLASEQQAYGVARIDEALELRAGTRARIVVMSEAYNPKLLKTCLEQQFDLVIHDAEAVQQIETSDLNTSAICFWLKVDTGMHRLGIRHDQVETCYKSLQKRAKQVILMSHLASADDLQSASFSQQAALFRAIQHSLQCEASLCNSAAMLRSSEDHYDWVRPGLALFGHSPLSNPTQPLKPVMQFTAPVIASRRIQAGESVGYGDTWRTETATNIVTIAVGYADGYPRITRNGTAVAINGKRYALAGRVSMDMITVDVGDDDITIGSEAELWGDTVSIDEVAAAAQTISYELLCAVSQRVERVYMST